MPYAWNHLYSISMTIGEGWSRKAGDIVIFLDREVEDTQHYIYMQFLGTICIEEQLLHLAE